MTLKIERRSDDVTDAADAHPTTFDRPFAGATSGVIAASALAT
jgi:hypothetical protein